MRIVLVAVVLATALFAGCSGGGGSGTGSSGSSSETPRVRLELDESLDRLRVVAEFTDAGAQWSRIQVEYIGAGLPADLFLGTTSANGYQNQLSSSNGAHLTVGGQAVMVSTKALSLRDPDGQFIEFCGDAAQAGTARLRIVDAPSGTVVGDFTFVNVTPC